jgi:hypothetical protein
MSKGEGSFFNIVWFPFPWPPPEPVTVFTCKNDGLTVSVVAMADGRLALTTFDLTGTLISQFISQPIALYGVYSASLHASWSPSKSTLYVNGQELLPGLPGVQAFSVLPQHPPFGQRSFDDPTAALACHKWIQNRKDKFTPIKAARPDRRLKTSEEEANNLCNSIAHIKELLQRIESGERAGYLLGTLATEMRACICWPHPKRDAKEDKNWNPLLLRMASKADLPLPVYSLSRSEAEAEAKTPLLKETTLRLVPDPARIERRYVRDQICDLQEALVNTMLRIGPMPTGRTIIAVDLIRELAHTEGAAHYDRDASEFVDVLKEIEAFDADALTSPNLRHEI